jgi:hypothetical protein
LNHITPNLLENNMKTFLSVLTLVGLTLTAAAPTYAAFTTNTGVFDGSVIGGAVDKRRPRVPGGSGCDTPRDIREHPACSPG